MSRSRDLPPSGGRGRQDDTWLICEQQRLDRADLRAYALTYAAEGQAAAQAKFLKPIDDKGRHGQ